MGTLVVRDSREMKKRTEELMTSFINGALQRRQIVFPVGEETVCLTPFITALVFI